MLSLPSVFHQLTMFSEHRFFPSVSQVENCVPVYWNVSQMVSNIDMFWLTEKNIAKSQRNEKLFYREWHSWSNLIGGSKLTMSKTKYKPEDYEDSILFATDYDEIKDKSTTQALQALIYEDSTPEGIAKNFKVKRAYKILMKNRKKETNYWNVKMQKYIIKMQKFIIQKDLNNP